MSDSEPEFDQGLEGYSDSGSDFHDFPAPELPRGVKKDIISHCPSGTILKRPLVGDEVAIDYVSKRPDGFVLDSSFEKGEPYRFLLGRGQVIKGWDLGVATMRLHEKAKFTVSPDYIGSLGGVKADSPVVYEIELVEWISRFDLLGDGTVIKSILRRAEDKRKLDPDEVCDLRYKCTLVDSGRVLMQLNRLEYTMNCTTKQADGLINSALLDRNITTMKRGEVASLSCSASVGYGEDSDLPDGVTPDDEICIEVELRDFLLTSDISFERDKSVMKRSLHCREAWAECKDAGRCTLKVISVTDGAEVIVSDMTVEFTIGDGEVCDALECIAASMQHHEIATVTCRSAEMCEEPRLGLTPGRPGLVFHVEVVDYQPGPQEEARRDPEKIEFLEARKASTGDLFKAGRFALAAFRYLRAYELLGYVDDFRNVRGGAERLAKVSGLKKLCMLNRSLCLVKAGQYKRAVKACDIILEDDSQNAKALFRRAQAKLALGNTLEAIRNVRSLLEVEPQNIEVHQLHKEVKAVLKADDSNAASTYAKMCDGLGKLPHPLDVD